MGAVRGTKEGGEVEQGEEEGKEEGEEESGGRRSSLV